MPYDATSPYVDSGTRNLRLLCGFLLVLFLGAVAWALYAFMSGVLGFAAVQGLLSILANQAHL
jgi:hypothetical protein